MKNQVDYFRKTMKTLEDLNKDYPGIEISKHLMLATNGDIDFISNKELWTLLEKYKITLEMDHLVRNNENLFIEDEESEDDWNESDY